MSRKMKRASILTVIIYIMINSFVWGLMKAYISSNNTVSRERLVMAQINDSPKGREINIMGNSFILPDKKAPETNAPAVLKTMIPAKVKAVSMIFRQTAQTVVRAISE